MLQPGLQRHPLVRVAARAESAGFHPDGRAPPPAKDIAESRNLLLKKSKYFAGFFEFFRVVYQLEFVDNLLDASVHNIVQIVKR